MSKPRDHPKLSDNFNANKYAIKQLPLVLGPGSLTGFEKMPTQNSIHKISSRQDIASQPFPIVNQNAFNNLW